MIQRRIFIATMHCCGLFIDRVYCWGGKVNGPSDVIGYRRPKVAVGMADGQSNRLLACPLWSSSVV